MYFTGEVIGRKVLKNELEMKRRNASIIDAQQQQRTNGDGDIVSFTLPGKGKVPMEGGGKKRKPMRILVREAFHF